MLNPNQSNIADCDRMHATMHCTTINISLLFDNVESEVCTVLVCCVNTVYGFVVSYLYPILGFLKFRNLNITNMIKVIMLYCIAMLLGVLIVLLAIHLRGFEETMIYGLAFVIGKLLIRDLDR